MNGLDLQKEKLFRQGKVVIVAIDHGMFDRPIPGMYNIKGNHSENQSNH